MMLTVLITISTILKNWLQISKIKTINQNRNVKTLNTVLEAVDSIIIIGATSTSITLSITGVGLNILPISASIASNLSLGNKILHKLIINTYKKHKKRYEKDQQSIEYFDRFYTKSLQGNVTDKSGYESLSNIVTKFVDENKNESFL